MDSSLYTIIFLNEKNTISAAVSRKLRENSAKRRTPQF